MRRRVRVAAVGAMAAMTLAGGGVAVVHASNTSGQDADDRPGVAIECGGYDEDGRLVNAEAAAITSAPIGPDGLPEIPDVCAGYTADGTFIGDD